MSKVQSSVRKYVAEFGENIFACDGGILFCKVCEINVNSVKRFTVTQHLKTDKHIRAVHRKNENKSKFQQLLPNKSMFAKDLCNTLLLANILLEKWGNRHVRLFLENYTGKDIPSVSLLRKTYIDECYENTMNKIRNEVMGKKIWMSIDETSDATGRYIANVVMGTLEVDKPGKIFLLSCNILEKANHSTISKLFDKAMFSLWPSAANAIKPFYSKMIHITCLAHGLHRTSEKIRSLFPKVDELIANMKKVFLKATSRVELFKKKSPDVPLPPSPIITRWGTWLDAATYYCEYFKPILNVVQQLNAEDAICIEKVKKIMLEENILEADLVFKYQLHGYLQ
ncbi:hypothetical protein QTP88_017630 [Uroleucon formosanum]